MHGSYKIHVPYYRNPILNESSSASCPVSVNVITTSQEELIPLEKFSSFAKLNRVMYFVLTFIENLKKKIYEKDCSKANFKPNLQPPYERVYTHLIRSAQLHTFKEVFDYFKGIKSSEPPIVTQLNLFIDNEGIIRVQSKLKNLKASFGERCPILLEKNCVVAKSIIWDLHVILKHAGIYKVLASLRKEFWVTRGFVTVKQILNDCHMCKRLHGRTLKLNQNAYRTFRVNPEMIPYRNVAIDHIGPFTVKNSQGQNVKIYLLIITCLWTRAVNLIICPKIDSSAFLRALQLHVFEYGIPSLIISDNGSPIVAGVNQTITFLNDKESKDFLVSHNIRSIDFYPYPANASQLGGLVESLVKQVKLILTSSIRNNILSYFDFEYIVKEAIMLINKRPIAFNSALNKSCVDDSVIFPLTPELMVKGYEIPSINILPQIQSTNDNGDATWQLCNDFATNSNAQFQHFKKLKRVKSNLENLYTNEFRVNLMQQSTNVKERYKKRNHISLKIGNIVAIKKPFTKPFDFPLGIVVEIETNDIDEVTAAKIKKSNKEIVRRHVTDLILIDEGSVEQSADVPTSVDGQIPAQSKDRGLFQRQAADRCNQLNAQLAHDGLM